MIKLTKTRKIILCCTSFAFIVIIFFLSIFSSCYNTPLSILHTTDDMVPTNLRQKVKILNYNMFLRSNPVPADPGTDNDWKNERLDLFIATKLANYDILLLQEVWTPMNEGRKEKLMQAAQEQGFPYYVRSACLGKLTDAMLLILSRHPIVSAEEFTYTQAVGDEVMATKGVLGAEIYLHGHKQCRVDVFTTHLQSGESNNGGNEIRRAQTIELGEFVRHRQRTEKIGSGSGSGLGGVNGDVNVNMNMGIIGGDFNIDGRKSRIDGTPSAGYQFLRNDLLSGMQITNTSLLNMMLPPWRYDNALHQQWNESNAIPITSPNRLGSSKLIGMDPNKGKGLDYIFVGKFGIEDGNNNGVRLIRNASRINTMMVENEPFVSLSDHYAVEMEIECVQ